MGRVLPLTHRIAGVVHWPLLVGIVVAGALVSVLPLWLAVFVPVGSICVLVLAARVRRVIVRYQLARAFDGFAPPRPGLRWGYLYGYPHLTLMFETEQHMREAQAAGHLSAFERSIAELYAGVEGSQGAFDVQRAIFPTFRGRTIEVTAPDGSVQVLRPGED